MENPDQGSGDCLTLQDFSEDCKKLDLIAFTERHGESFLLHHGPLGRLNHSNGVESTLAPKGLITNSDRPVKPKANFLVFPINRPKTDGKLVSMICLGRSAANEIVVPDDTISEVQAFIRRDDRGDIFIQDTGSRNGTWVNNEQVPSQGEGPPVRLRTGSRLKVGQVKLTFLLSEQFYSMVTRLNG
jgi:hypothetical protein